MTAAELIARFQRIPAGAEMDLNLGAIWFGTEYGWVNLLDGCDEDGVWRIDTTGPTVLY